AWELPPTTDRGGRGETIERRGERPRRSGARSSDGARRDRCGDSACCSCGARGTRERRCDDSACRSRGRETAGAAAPANWACRARQTPVNCCICPRSSATSRAVAGAAVVGAGASWFAPAVATATSPGGIGDGNPLVTGETSVWSSALLREGFNLQERTTGLPRWGRRLKARGMIIRCYLLDCSWRLPTGDGGAVAIRDLRALPCLACGFGEAMAAVSPCPAQQRCSASPGECSAIDCAKVCANFLPGGSYRGCCKNGRCCCFK
ncbi:hypothetical protein Taro_034919, partial [Colocasia esculenta]|nr:hypothetical protein [Colocasia esculenta]